MKLLNSIIKPIRKLVLLLNCKFARKAVYLTTLLFCTLFSENLNAQNVVVSGAISGNGSYPDFHAAISAINASVQTGATITVSVLYSDATSAPVTLNAGAWTSLAIIPSGGASRVLSCPYTSGALLTLNGADNVLINGLNAGGNALSLNHIVAGANSCAIKLIGICLNNTITNCVVTNTNSGGAGTTGTLTGAICFSGTTTTAFQNTCISSCTISGTKGIFADPGAAGIGVSPNVIQNCHFFYPSSGGSLYTAIDLQAHRYWLITGNHIYYPSLTSFGGVSRFYGIRLLGAYQHTVTNNVIGYANSSKTFPAAIHGYFYTAIEVSASTKNIFNSIQGNTITAINYTPTGLGSGVNNEDGDFCGIRIDGAGSFEVGTLSPNIVGGSVGTGSINSRGMIVGINSNATGSVMIHNNVIGALSSTNNLGGLAGINVSEPPAFISISGNMIGNPTSNNMVSGLQSVNSQSTLVSGIYFDGNSGFNPLGNASISSNTIQNLSSFGTSTTSYVQGICFSGGVGPNSSTITSNIVTDLTSPSAMDWQGLPNGEAGASGIKLEYGISHTILSNTITNISLTGTTNASSQAVGIFEANISGGLISKNVIYNITNAATSTVNTDPSVAAGIIIGPSSSGSLNISNNFISLGNGSPHNTCFEGIQVYNGLNQYIHYNTINIEGTVSSGAMRSFGFYRGDFGVFSSVAPFIDFRNNIITNTRTGGTGSHYAISNNYGITASTSGWGNNASNYNVLNANPATVGYWSGDRTFASWKTVSNCDANSFSNVTVSYMNSANNLHLNMGLISTPIESGAQAISTITTDIDNQNRPGPLGSVNGGGASPDIGADEFDGVLPDVSAPVISYTNLTTLCSSGDRTLSVTISDLSGVPSTGTLQPRIYFKKNAGTYVSGQGSLSAGTATSGTWNFTISLAALGGVNDGDVISYFIIAQDQYTNSINISSNPSSGLVALNVNSVTMPPTITTQSFTINLVPAVIANSGSICSGGSFVILPAGASTYTYSGGSATVSPITTTSYSISGTSSLGCVSVNTAISTVTVISLPVVSVNSGSICAGDSFTLVPVGALTYTFINGGTVVSPLVNSSYSITGTSSLGCISSNTAVANVSVSPLPTLSVNSGSICVGSIFTIVPSGAATYTFSGGSNTVSPGLNTSYSITGTSIDGCHASNIVIATVSVSPLPTLSVNSGTICSGNSFTIFPAGAFTYTYSGGSATVNPAVTTSYSVTGTSSLGCAGSNTAVSAIQVNTLPVVTASTSNSLMCAGETVTLTASGANQYTWNNGDNGIATIISPSLTVNYTVTGTDLNGCSKTATITQSVDACLGYSHLSAENEQWAVYPNPNHGEFIVESRSVTGIILTNALGQVVLKQFLIEGKNKIDLSEEARGIYFIRFEQNGNVIKIVKE